jgi:hypothetical protein
VGLSNACVGFSYGAAEVSQKEKRDNKRGFGLLALMGVGYLHIMFIITFCLFCVLAQAWRKNNNATLC